MSKTINLKLSEILHGVDSSTIVEIGAHLGTDTKELVGKADLLETYIAVEPDYRTFPVLVDVMRDLAGETEEKSAALIPINVAISDETGPGQIYLSDGPIPGKERRRTDSSSIMMPRPELIQHLGCVFNKTQCHLMRLDDLCAGIRAIDLIWCDVQGAELKVVNGGRETLRLTKWFYVEVQEGRYFGQPGVKKFLRELGSEWSVEDFDGANLLLKNELWEQLS